MGLKAGRVIKTEKGASYLIAEAETNMVSFYLISLASFAVLAEVFDEEDIDALLLEDYGDKIAETLPFGACYTKL